MSVQNVDTGHMVAQSKLLDTFFDQLKDLTKQNSKTLQVQSEMKQIMAELKDTIWEELQEFLNTFDGQMKDDFESIYESVKSLSAKIGGKLEEQHQRLTSFE